MCSGKSIAGNNTTPRGKRGIVVSVSMRLILDGFKPGQFVSTLNTIIITEKAWQENRGKIGKEKGSVAQSEFSG
jgi:hypothetical protein